MGQLTKRVIGGETVFVSEGVGDDAEVMRARQATSEAFEVIVDALRARRIHPVDALNALLNVWHAIAVKVAPETILDGLDAMREFHAAYVVAHADA